MNTTFHGLPTRTLDNGYLRLEFLVSAGPRIVRLFAAGSETNLFAEVPNSRILTPYGEYQFFGGHRLWHAPEAMPRSYLPDNEGLAATEIPGGVRLSQPVEIATGIRKHMDLVLAPDRAQVAVVHTLENQGLWPVELAPWAVTQLRLGGLAVLPQTEHALDRAGLLPNRSLMLWPYTRLADPRLSLNDDVILIAAQAQRPPVKVGYLNRQGWLGYLTEGVFFVKRFEPKPEQPHVDLGCNAECYCDDNCIEAETLGPLSLLEPGDKTVHVEHWELHRAVDVQPTLAGMRALISELGLPTG